MPISRASVAVVPDLLVLVLLDLEAGDRLLVLDQADDVAAVGVEDGVDLGLQVGVLHRSGSCRRLCSEGHVTALVEQDQPKALAQAGEGAPELCRVDHDLVGGQSQHSLDEGVVGGGEADECTLGTIGVVVHRGLEQLAPVFRESLMEDVAHLEAAARVDGQWSG